MANVTLIFKDGRREELVDRGAPGGSYAQSVRYEWAFCVIESAYGAIRAIPASDLQEVQIEARRRW
jgi:hypothetical protein